MSSYSGSLPYTDEHDERLANAEHVQSGTFGAKRVILYDSSGNEVVTPYSSSSIVSGTTTVTTAGTPVRVTSVSTPIKGVWVCADLLAGSPVTVGDSSVVGNSSGMKGVILTPGNPPIFLMISNLNLLYVDSVNDGGKLAYLYFA